MTSRGSGNSIYLVGKKILQFRRLSKTTCVCSLLNLMLQIKIACDKLQLKSNKLHRKAGYPY